MKKAFFSKGIASIANSIFTKQLILILLVSFLIVATLVLNDFFIYRANDRFAQLVETKVQEIFDTTQVTTEFNSTFSTVHLLLHDFLSKDIQWQKVNQDFTQLQLLNQKIMVTLSQLDQFIIDRQLSVKRGSREEEIAFNQFAIMVPALLEIFYEVKTQTQILTWDLFHADFQKKIPSREPILRLINEMKVGLEATPVSWIEAKAITGTLKILVDTYSTSWKQFFLQLDSFKVLKNSLAFSEKQILEDISLVSEKISLHRV